MIRKGLTTTGFTTPEAGRKAELSTAKLENEAVRRRGFTLIELLVVVSIVGVLAGVLIVNFAGAQRRARDAKAQADVSAVMTATELYKEAAIPPGLPVDDSGAAAARCVSAGGQPLTGTPSTDCFNEMVRLLATREPKALPTEIVRPPPGRQYKARARLKDATGNPLLSYCIQTNLGEPTREFFKARDGATVTETSECRVQGDT